MEVLITPEALEQFDELRGKIKGRVSELIRRLVNWPEVSGVKPLRGELFGHYRVRTGDYRLQFRVTETQVIVEKIGHRRDFYDN